MDQGALQQAAEQPGFHMQTLGFGPMAGLTEGAGAAIVARIKSSKCLRQLQMNGLLQKVQKIAG